MENNVLSREPTVAPERGKSAEKRRCGLPVCRQADSREDFVYLDAGRLRAIYWIFWKKQATFVTNAVSHAQRLAAREFMCFWWEGR